MTDQCAPSLQHLPRHAVKRGPAVRTGLLHGCALSALAVGLTLTGSAASAGCLTVGLNYPCSLQTDETLNTGDSDNLVYSGGATGSLTVNAGGGNDSIVFGEASSLIADTGTALVDAGSGADLVTVQDASTLTGDILGGADGDNILIEEGSALTGSIDGGTGDDSLTLRDAATRVTGDLSGGDGADVFMLRDASTLAGDIDAGAGADRITLKLGTTLDGHLLAGADTDTVLIRGLSHVTGDIATGDGADILTIQERSLVEGSVYGNGGDDSLLLEGDTVGGSTIEGNFDAGAGNDTLYIRGGSTVLQSVAGGSGNDALLVTGSSTVGGSVDGGDDDDLVTVQGTSRVQGSVTGGGGTDSLLVEGDATVDGAMSGGAGNDLVTVTSGAVSGGISGGDGNDTVNLSGGTIGGLDGGDALELGSGDDRLGLTFDTLPGAAALDLSAVLEFDGGTGANSATLTGLGAAYAEGGLFGRSFTGWDAVTAAGSFLEFAADATVTSLDLTASSALFQTQGARGLRAADGSETAGLAVDATSYVDLRDAAFALMLPPSNLPQSNLPQAGVLLPPFPQSVADDSITVADLTLTGSATPLTLPTLRVDFDADDTTFRNARDDAVSGNADQIDVGNSIVTTGPIGIRIDATGGYLDMGMPVGLSGSVAIIDDLQADALSRPGIAATLVASSTYVPVTSMPVDPARQWALVDQGNGGVYLQWTTVIDDQTVGPNAGAELAVAQGGGEVLSAVLTGLTDDRMAKRPVCADAATATAGCGFAPVSVWAMASSSASGPGSVETSGQSLTGGLDYTLGGGWNGGLFATLQQGSAGLGFIDGAFGPRASNADSTAGYLGAYILTEQDGAYLSAMGAVGKATTDLVNGALFGATSSHDSLVGLVGATAGKRVALGRGLDLDPRVEALYATSDGKGHTDSEGLAVTPDAAHGRIAATVGLTYQAQNAPLSLGLRAGTAFLFSDTSVSAGEAGGGPTTTVESRRSDKVFTASFEGRWQVGDRATLIGSVSTDRGGDLDATRGGLTFSYSF